MSEYDVIKAGCLNPAQMYIGPLTPQNLTDQVKAEIERLTAQLTAKRKLLELLEANPDFEQIITLLRY